MSDTAQQPTEFIERKIGEGAAAFALYCVLPEGTQSLMDRFPVKMGFFELRDRVEERCERHARLGSTVGTFAVEAIDEGGKSLGFEVFRVSANVPGSKVVLSEPANEVGLLAQLMRHNEFHQRTMASTTATILDWQAKMLDEAKKEAQGANDMRLKMFEVMEALADKRHERDLAREEQSSRLKLKQDALEKVMSLGSLVAGHIAPQLAPPEKAQEFGLAVAAIRIFETLTPDQLRAILGLLGPEQQALVLRAMQTMAAQREGKETSDVSH